VSFLYLQVPNLYPESLFAVGVLPSRKGNTMLVSFIVTSAVGTILGLRFKIFVLVPAMLFVGIATSAAGMLAHCDARFIWLSVAACLVLLQIGYLAGCFLSTQKIFSVFHLGADARAKT
jgi:hypothetical protein